tara:strand:- start:2186 stop:2425 length:240 start_codon:yes stop_codon:yes gene_type:complete
MFLMSKKIIVGALLGGLGLCFAVFGIIIGVLPNLNWWGYSWHYIGGQIGELAIGWTLVGLVLAKVMSNTEPSPTPATND